LLEAATWGLARTLVTFMKGYVCPRGLSGVRHWDRGGAAEEESPFGKTGNGSRATVAAS